jgi:polyisoprenoid-binding protein YceI
MNMSGPARSAQTLHSPPTNGRYEADPARSRLAFKAKAFGLVWVRGDIPAISGSFEIENGILRGEGLLAANRIDTGLSPRDWHLRSSHYLGISRHPTIRMSVEDAKISSGTAVCEVVVKGVASTVNFDLVTIEDREGTLHLTARSTVDRTVYPMLPPLAGVSRLVHVELTVAATPQRPSR